MRLIIALSLVVAVLAGCGARTASDPITNYPMPNQDDAMNAFLESVQEHYATRADGKLGEPRIAGNNASYLYRYEKVTGGNHTEEVRFNGHAERNIRRNDGTYKKEPAHFQVGAWHHREGADPEIPAVRDAIVAGMQKRLAAKP